MVQKEDIKEAASYSHNEFVEYFSFIDGAEYVIESLGWTKMEIEPTVAHKPIIVSYRTKDRFGKIHKYYDIYNRLNSGKFFRDVRDPESYTWDEINKFAEGQEPMWTYVESLLP